VKMYGAAKKATDFIRAGNGPYLLEAMCYRFRGHSMADPELYREKDEVARWRLRDPITSLRATLISDGASEDELNVIDAQVETEIEDAVRFADQSPEPAPEELYTNVYVGVARETHHG